uniref:Uncharacterized protein n=1 Tax=Timema bartmani TaxID=61472 RepID=A0A7R9F802_9NEOP|nr:unnamed protein product [Timema bartmani]
MQPAVLESSVGLAHLQALVYHYGHIQAGHETGGHVLMISSKPVTLTTETEEAMDLFLDDAIVVVSVAVQPGQPDIVKTARESCPAS